MKNIILPIVALVILCGFVAFTMFYQPEPEVNIVYVQLPGEVIEVERVVYEPVTKYVPVYVPKEVEVIKEVPIEAGYFETVEEFEKWVENNHGLINVGQVLFKFPDNMNDCEDQADRWQQRALEDGYLVSVCPVNNGYVFKTRVGSQKYHVGLWTSIGNNYYYWDSVTGEITKIEVVRD